MLMLKYAMALAVANEGRALLTWIGKFTDIRMHEPKVREARQLQVVPVR